MSIFDSISDTLVDLGSDIFGKSVDTDSTFSTLLDVGSSLGGAGIRALGALNNAQDRKTAKEDSLYRFLQVDSSKQSTDQGGKFRATKTGFDNANYSASASEINAQWQRILQGYVSNSLNPQSQVSKY